jgi:cytochrome P450
MVAGAPDDASANLLSVMLAAGLSAEEVRDELIALLFAGYDSTATALSLTLGLLADHPSVQADLRSELDTVLDDGPPTPAALDDLPLLDAVVRESLRLYPPQYVLFREPVERVQLAGYRIEPGTTVVLAPWVVQRDPQFWDDPGQFRPERWLDGGTATTGDRPEFAYVPYGAGPRHCLGAGLANQTLRLVLAIICGARQLELVDGLDVSADPTLSPGAVEIRAHPDG